jgi:formamidopyrimidine-DNA glycosylase
MPELPEVEAVCRKLRKEAAGTVIAEAKVMKPRSSRGQHTAELDLAAGRKIVTIERRGKNIVVHLSGGYALRVHLMMTGNLFVIPDARLHSARVRVHFRLQDGRGLVFEDARILGNVSLYTEDALEKALAKIGIEPLSKAFTVEKLVEMAKRSRLPAKLYLMDQHRIAGIGNMYAAEALFRARINPKQPMNAVKPAKLKALHQAIIDVLKEAIKAAVRSYSKPGSYGEDMDFNVYGRKGKPCHACGKPIARIEQGGRSTYYCPHCQR